MGKQAGKQFNVIGDGPTSLVSLRFQVILQTWMLGLIIIVLVVPQLQR